MKKTWEPHRFLNYLFLFHLHSNVVSNTTSGKYRHQNTQLLQYETSTLSAKYSAFQTEILIYFSES